MRGLLFFILVFLPFISFGQGKVTRQETNNTSTQSTSTTQNTTHKPSPSNNKKRATTPSIRISLATEINGQRKYFSTTEWKNLSVDERVNYNKIGLVIESGKELFLFSLHPLPNWSDWKTTRARSGNQLPSSKQWQIIKQNKSKVQNALTAFGGGYVDKRRWWNRGEDPSWTVMFYDGTKYDKVSPDTGNAGVWLATDKIENGFQDIIIPHSPSMDYDYISSSSSEANTWRLVKSKEKFGFIDSKGNETISLMYDSIYCGGEYGRVWQLTDLMAVCKNGRWGYINRDGKEVVPVVYDRVEADVLSKNSHNKYDRIVKHGKMGLVDFNGDIIIPPLYDIIEDEEGKDLIFFKDGDKYGYITLNNQIVIPCIYDYTTGFAKDAELAPVGKNGKYGFIDKNGNIKIELSYDFAGDFNNGLAPVVKNDKVGFIDEDGQVVVPFEYDAVYSSHYYDFRFKHLSHKALGLGYGFEYGNISFVKKNNKWGIIDKSGKLITPYKYDSVKSRSSYKSEVVLDNKSIFIRNDSGLEIEK